MAISNGRSSSPASLISSRLAICALAREVDHQVARDGEQPGIEARLAVVLRAAQQHPHPGLLEEVFGDLALAGQEQQVAQQAVLIELDQLVEQFGVLRFRPRQSPRFRAGPPPVPPRWRSPRLIHHRSCRHLGRSAIAKPILLKIGP
jgi:hypothetical protein